MRGHDGEKGRPLQRWQVDVRERKGIERERGVQIAGVVRAGDGQWIGRGFVSSRPTSDQTVPWAIANAAFKKQKRNPGVTETVKMSGRGHTLTIGAGWREVAETALEFAKRFTSRPADRL